MTVEVEFRCGGSFHSRGVVSIRQVEDGSIEVARRGESPQRFTASQISQFRVLPDPMRPTPYWEPPSAA